MHLKNVTMDHGNELIHRVLGITDEQRTLIRERIFFTTINMTLKAYELFEDIEDAPPAMKTLTSHLQGCLQLIDDPMEYEYTLLHFFNYQKMACSSAQMHNELKQQNLSKEQRIKMGILSLIEDLRRSDDEDEEEESEPVQMIDKLNGRNMLKRVDFVVRSVNDFDTYLRLLRQWAGKSTSDSEFDVDSLLSDLLGDN